MANDLTKAPLVIDTASGSALTTSSYKVKKIRWVGATTAGHSVVIQDQFARPFWESKAAGANYIEESDFSTYTSNNVVLSGILVPTLSSGKIYIYY